MQGAADAPTAATRDLTISPRSPPCSSLLRALFPQVFTDGLFWVFLFLRVARSFGGPRSRRGEGSCRQQMQSTLLTSAMPALLARSISADTSRSRRLLDAHRKRYARCGPFQSMTRSA